VAEERSPLLNAGERGAALLIALIALAALMPLALVLSDLVTMRQRQVAGHQQNVGGQAMVRGALDLTMAQLRARQITLEPAQSTQFELEEPPRPVHVRVSRRPDVVLGLDGSVSDLEDADALDLDALGIDRTGGAVRQYRRLELYLVEAESPVRYPFAAVRLLAVVGRLDEGVLCLGVRYDRGYFP
jgi:hypothetical protein